MNSIVLVPSLLAVASGLAAASATGIDFGAQPVALGAGARALGMGGAFSAVADDASAVTWNPAGLTQCERPEAAISLGWYRNDMDSAMAGRSDAQALRLDHASGLLPFFAFGCQQVVGLAWQRPYDFSQSITSDTEVIDLINEVVTRSHEKRDSAGSFASLGLSYAIEVRPGLSLGATVNRWDDATTRASHYHTDTYSSTLLDIAGGLIKTTTLFNTSSSTRVVSGTSVVLGSFWQATPALTVAVVAKPAYHLRLEQDAQVRSSVDDGTSVTETNWNISAAAELTHPSSLTVGTAWRQGDVHTLTCDATVTRWRQYRIDDGSALHSPLSTYVDPSDFPDLWTVRLGYEYIAILPRVIVVPRVGVLLEDLPAVTRAPDLVQVELASATRNRWWGASAGLSVCQRHLIWDLGVQMRYGNNVGTGQFAPEDQTVDLFVTTARLGLTVQF